MRICAIIPARGGSKRLKRKNIYPVWGKPMLFWPIRACMESKYDIDIWVSTEDDQIAEVAKSFGVNVHTRDPELSRDHVYKQVAIRSAARHIVDNFYNPDIFISLQANSPTLTSDQIDSGISALIEMNKDEIFSVDSELMQNAGVSVFKGEYVFQKDLSTNCGVVIAEAHDVHTLDDVKIIEKSGEK